MLTDRVTPAAAKSIAKIADREARARVAAAVDLLATDPRPPAAKPLKGSAAWRVRIGDYRILYAIQDDRLLVVVVDAGHRREIYR